MSVDKVVATAALQLAYSVRGAQGLISTLEL